MKNSMTGLIAAVLWLMFILGVICGRAGCKRG